MRNLYQAAWSFLALLGVLVAIRDLPSAVPSSRHTHAPVPAVTPESGAALWFASMRPHCNAVEVETRHRWQPPPPGAEGYSAACWALAGRIDRAREIIGALEGGDRARAAGIVFDAGHPVADAGDDRSAGPIMELVIEYLPDHYMALYHAGMARFGLGDGEAARRYLMRFMELYAPDDGWSSSARAALDELES